MNIKALNWYRQNSNYTENSGKVNRLPIMYFDTQIVKGGRQRYQDIISTACDMSATEKLTQRIISLPIYPELSMNDAETIVTVLKKLLN